MMQRAQGQHETVPVRLAGGGKRLRPTFPKEWSRGHIFYESKTWLLPAYLHVQ